VKPAGGPGRPCRADLLCPREQACARTASGAVLLQAGIILYVRARRDGGPEAGCPDILWMGCPTRSTCSARSPCWPLDDPTFSMLGAHPLFGHPCNQREQRTRHVRRRFHLSTCRGPRPAREWQMMRHSGARHPCCEACDGALTPRTPRRAKWYRLGLRTRTGQHRSVPLAQSAPTKLQPSFESC